MSFFCARFALKWRDFPLFFASLVGRNRAFC